MIDALRRRARPALLVSVRSSTEAVAALAGGADVIDVKEPARGPLGAADASTIASVVRAVSGRAPVTAALGELVDLIGIEHRPLPPGLLLVKVGLSQCRDQPDWPSTWRTALTELSCGPAPSQSPAPTAVVYADWQPAGAPHPQEILSAALDAGCPALLVDTWNKSAGSLFDHWPPEQLSRYARSAQSNGLIVALAGSLNGKSFSTAVSLVPDLVAVRSAACDAGRSGVVSSERVRALQLAIRGATPAPNWLPSSVVENFS